MRNLVAPLSFIFVMFVGCASQQPTPTPLSTDIFDGFVADCSQAATAAPIDQVRMCLDLANIAECLVELTLANTPDTVACTVRALTMGLHVRIARGATDPQIQAAADAWIRSKRIGYR